MLCEQTILLFFFHIFPPLQTEHGVWHNSQIFGCLASSNHVECISLNPRYAKHSHIHHSFVIMDGRRLQRVNPASPAPPRTLSSPSSILRAHEHGTIVWADRCIYRGEWGGPARDKGKGTFIWAGLSPLPNLHPLP